MVVIPPDAAGAIIIDTSCIWESIGLRIVQDLRHKAPGIVKNSGSLCEVSIAKQFEQRDQASRQSDLI